MNDQELEYHVSKLEKVFSSASPEKREGMRPGIERMIRSLKSGNARIPLSLRRLQREIERDSEEDFFENMPV